MKKKITKVQRDESSRSVQEHEDAFKKKRPARAAAVLTLEDIDILQSLVLQELELDLDEKDQIYFRGLLRRLVAAGKGAP